MSVILPHAQFLTDFADQAVLLPLACGLIAVFALSGWRRGAGAWALAIGGTLAAMLLLKLVFLACGHLLFGTGLQNPSGHTASAAAIYGALLALAARYVTGRAYWTVPCALFMALSIGATRLALGVHTGPEVLVGGTVGICGAIAATLLAGPPPPGLKPRTVVAVTAAILLLFHGLHMPAQAAIRNLAFNIWPLTECRPV